MSRKSFQERIVSLSNGIREKKKINDQRRKSLILEYFEGKIAEIKSLLTSIRLDSEQRVTDALSTLDRVDLMLEEIDPQIRDATFDQADKDRLLQETARLKALSEKWRNPATRLSKAYKLSNFIRKQRGLGQEGKGGIFKKLRVAIFKSEDSLTLATVAAMVGALGVVPYCIKKYLEHNKGVIEHIRTHTKEYYGYVAKKTSIVGWLPKDSSECGYYEPVLKELIKLDSEVEYTGAGVILSFAILLFTIFISPFIIIPWMYMDRIQQILEWFR